MTNEHAARPSARFEGEAGLLDLEHEASDLLEQSVGSRHGHAQHTLYRYAGVTIAMFALQENAALPRHAADGVVSVHVLRGQITINAGATRFDLPAGRLVRMEPRVAHDVRASTPSVILLHIARVNSDEQG